MEARKLTVIALLLLVSSLLTGCRSREGLATPPISTIAAVPTDHLLGETPTIPVSGSSAPLSTPIHKVITPTIPALETGVMVGRQANFTVIDIGMNPEVGWLVTDDGTIWLTTNKGESWKDVTPARQDGKVASAQFFDEDRGWAVKETPKTIALYKFSNGRWRKVFALNKDEYLASYTPISLYALADGKHIWINARVQTSSNFNFGELFISAHGGEQWEKVVHTPSGGRIYFNDAMNGWLVGGAENNELWHTGDGGKTWKAVNFDVSLPADVSFELPAFANERDGWLVAYGKQNYFLLASHDGGATWALEAKGQALTRATFILTPQAAAGIARFLKNRFPKDVFYVAMANQKVGWAYSERGECNKKKDCVIKSALYLTTDGGYSWRSIALPVKVEATPVPSTPQFTPSPVPHSSITEIKFPLMTTRYVAGCGETEEIPPNGVRVYRLWLQRGQWIRVLLAYDDLEEDALQAKITSPAGKQFVLKPSIGWSGRLPKTGLYSISVFSRAQTVKHYALIVDAPVEIPPASLVRGFVARGRIVGACGEGEYLLSLKSPLPKLDIKVQKVEGKGRLVLAVVGLDDHIPYLRAMMGMTEYELKGLPPQKYLIRVIPWESVIGSHPFPQEPWIFELAVGK